MTVSSSVSFKYKFIEKNSTLFLSFFQKGVGFFGDIWNNIGRCGRMSDGTDKRVSAYRVKGNGGIRFGKINGHRAGHGCRFDLCRYDSEGSTAVGAQ